MIAHPGSARQRGVGDLLLEGHVPVVHARSWIIRVPITHRRIAQGESWIVERDGIRAVLAGNNRWYGAQEIPADAVRRKGGRVRIVLEDRAEWRVLPEDVVPAVDGQRMIRELASAANHKFTL